MRRQRAAAGTETAERFACVASCCLLPIWLLLCRFHAASTLPASPTVPCHPLALLRASADSVPTSEELKQMAKDFHYDGNLALPMLGVAAVLTWLASVFPGHA